MRQRLFEGFESRSNAREDCVEVQAASEYLVSFILEIESRS